MNYKEAFRRGLRTFIQTLSAAFGILQIADVVNKEGGIAFMTQVFLAVGGSAWAGLQAFILNLDQQLSVTTEISAGPPATITTTTELSGGSTPAEASVVEVGGEDV